MNKMPQAPYIPPPPEGLSDCEMLKYMQNMERSMEDAARTLARRHFANSIKWLVIALGAIVSVISVAVFLIS